MRGPYMIGDPVYVKTEYCRASLLGKIEIIDGAHCVLIMCGYHHANRIPQKITVRIDQLEPHEDVVKRWEGAKKEVKNTRVKIEIDKLMEKMGFADGQKIDARIH